MQLGANEEQAVVRRAVKVRKGRGRGRSRLGLGWRKEEGRRKGGKRTVALFVIQEEILSTNTRITTRGITRGTLCGATLKGLAPKYGIF
jgi:hypothetical protein